MFFSTDLRSAATGILLIGTCALAHASSDDPTDSERTLTRLRELHAVLREFESAHGALPNTGEGFKPFVSVRELRRACKIRGCLDRDVWGHPMLLWSNGERSLLLSTGPDGATDLLYRPDDLFQRTFPSAVGPDDIILRDGQIAQLPPDPSPSVLQAVSAIRSLAGTLEEFADSNGRYPAPARGPAESPNLGRWLEPRWPRIRLQLHVWSTGNDYMIVCPGTDGKLDQDYGGVLPPRIDHPGSTRREGADLVFCNGRFLKWPAGVPEAWRE